MLQIKTIPHQHTSIVYKIRCDKSTILVECGRKKIPSVPEIFIQCFGELFWIFSREAFYLRQVRLTLLGEHVPPAEYTCWLVDWSSIASQGSSTTFFVFVPTGLQQGCSKYLQGNRQSVVFLFCFCFIYHLALGHLCLKRMLRNHLRINERVCHD